MNSDSTRRDAQRRFLELVAEAELPLPDEIWWEDASTVFCWREPEVMIYLDPDRDDHDPMDELEKAMIRGMPIEDWPVLE